MSECWPCKIPTEVAFVANLKTKEVLLRESNISNVSTSVTVVGGIHWWKSVNNNSQSSVEQHLYPFDSMFRLVYVVESRLVFVTFI